MVRTQNKNWRYQPSFSCLHPANTAPFFSHDQVSRPRPHPAPCHLYARANHNSRSARILLRGQKKKREAIHAGALSVRSRTPVVEAARARPPVYPFFLLLYPGGTPTHPVQPVPPMTTQAPPLEVQQKKGENKGCPTLRGPKSLAQPWEEPIDGRDLWGYYHAPTMNSASYRYLR